MTRNLILNDVARCHGTSSPLCLDCLRRLQAEIDLLGTDAPWTPWVEPAVVDVGCVNRMAVR